jgi:hypothetical protein
MRGVTQLIVLSPAGKSEEDHVSACNFCGAANSSPICRYRTEGTIKELTYWWPRPGSDKSLEKITFYTRVGDQDCGVGYYKD